MILGVPQRNKEGSPAKPTRYYSTKQEQAVAKALGGKRTANSGATMFGGKSDVQADQWSIECKTKTKSSDSISIQKSWITKNKEESIFDGKPYSAVAFNFGPDEPNYYIIDEDLFIELKTYLESK